MDLLAMLRGALGNVVDAVNVTGVRMDRIEIGEALRFY